MRSIVALVLFGLFSTACASTPTAKGGAYQACVRQEMRSGPATNPVGNGTQVRREIQARSTCR